jgi:hypothetical protein
VGLTDVGVAGVMEGSGKGEFSIDWQALKVIAASDKQHTQKAILFNIDLSFFGFFDNDGRSLLYQPVIMERRTRPPKLIELSSRECE